MANKIDGEDIYQIGINELTEKSSLDVADVVAIQQSVGGTVQKKSIGDVVAKAQAQADWNEADNTKADYIKNKPTIPAAQIQSDWNEADNTKLDYIKNKPSIPSVGDREIEIQENGTKVDSFTTNESGSTKKTINIAVPTATSDLNNDSGFITSHQSIKTLDTTDSDGESTNASEAIAGSGTIKLHKISKTGSYNDLLNKPTIPSAPGTLDTTQTTAQSTNASEALSGSVKLHKVSKTGSYSDLSNKPTIPTVNDSTISFTQGGVSKGSFTLNQASGTTIALDAGGGASVISVDGLCNANLTPYDGGSAFSSGYRVYNIDDDKVYEYDGNDFVEDTSVIMSDGQLVYSDMEKACYVYMSGVGLKPVSKGNVAHDLYYNDGAYHMECYVPKCDSLTRIDVSGVTSGFFLYFLNMLDTSTSTPHSEDVYESCHTILLANSTNTDLTVIVQTEWYTPNGNTKGMIYSGLGSSREFTLPASGYAEVSVAFGKYPSVIAKSDFDVYTV